MRERVRPLERKRSPGNGEIRRIANQHRQAKADILVMAGNASVLGAKAHRRAGGYVIDWGNRRQRGPSYRWRVTDRR